MFCANFLPHPCPITHPTFEKHAKPCKPMQSFVCPAFVSLHLTYQKANLIGLLFHAMSIIQMYDDRLCASTNLLILIMLKLFAKYTSIGIINTLIHWVVFAICFYVLHTNQALANFAGFVIAVSFSFFANAKFTFNASTTTMRYMLYVGFMGTLSAVVGWSADLCALPPIITLIAFSAISLVCGFIYSKFIVFREAK